MKQPEYAEGPEAAERFERGLIALFKVPKPPKNKQAVKPASVPKPKPDKD